MVSASSTSLFLITQRNTNNEIDIYIEQAQNDIWMDVVLNIFAFNQNRSFIVPSLSNELAISQMLLKLIIVKRLKLNVSLVSVR